MNSFHVTVRAPPEILNMACSYLTTEEDAFSASQVCRHWRGVLISSSSLWTRFPCHRLSRTIAGLGRCKSMPIQLSFNLESRLVALEKVLLHGNKITSLTIHHHLNQIPSLHRLFVSSGPFVEKLHIYCQESSGWRPDEQKPHEIWQRLPSLRRLLVSRYSIPIDQLVAPNLVHLALDEQGYRRNVTMQSILDALRGCPRLETLFISNSSIGQDPTRDHSPVSLPHLSSIELGAGEVHSGLVTHLRLPMNIAVAFRVLEKVDIYDDIPPAVIAAMQHVLGKIDIRCITLAVPLFFQDDPDLLVRFEGLQASLEISAYTETNEELLDVLFGPRGVLFSHSPRIKDVRELHIIGCPFVDDRVLDNFNAAMPSIVSISFFHCEGPNVLGPLTPTNPSSPPFPHLERIMVLGSESGLGVMAKARRDYGVPLKSLVVGRGSGGFEYDHVEDYAALGELVDELRTGCPAEVLEWGSENEVLNVWSTIGIPCPVSPNGKLMITS